MLGNRGGVAPKMSSQGMHAYCSFRAIEWLCVQVWLIHYKLKVPSNPAIYRLRVYTYLCLGISLGVPGAVLGVPVALSWVSGSPTVLGVPGAALEEWPSCGGRRLKGADLVFLKLNYQIKT